MRKSFVYLLVSAIVLISFGTLNSCKDYEDDLRQEAKINLDLQTTTLRTLLIYYKDSLAGEINTLKTLQTTCQTNCSTERARLEGLITALQNKVDSLAALDHSTVDLSNYVTKTDLGNAIEALRKALKADIDLLEANIGKAVERIAVLEANDSLYRASIASLQSTVGTLTTKLDAAEEDIDSLSSLLTQVRIDLGSVQTKLTTVETNLASLTTTVNDLSTNYSNLKTYVENMEKAQHYVDSIQDARIAEFKDIVKAQADNYEALLKDYKVLDDKYDSLLAVCGKLDQKYSDLKEQYTDLKGDMDDYQAYMDAYIAQLELLIRSMQGDASTTYNELVTLNNTVNTIDDKVDDLESDLSTLQTAVTNLLGRVTNDSIKVANIDSLLKVIRDKEQNDSLLTNTRIDTLSHYVDSLYDVMKDAHKNYDEVIAALQKRDSILTDSVSILNTNLITLDSKLSDVVKAYKSADSLLNERIDTLAQHVAKNEGRIKALEDAMDAVKGRVTKLEDANKKYITSIEIQGTVNPVFGTFNLPADLRSTILFGYYGKSKLATTGEFPSSDAGFYVDSNRMLTDDDYNMLGLSSSDLFTYKSGDILVNGGDHLDIGKLYMTVNPTGVDFGGTTFDLVNSADEVALATMSDLKKSDYKMQFGYTRSAKVAEVAANGFYETSAQIAKADVEKAAVHSEGMMNAIEKLMKKVKGAKVTVDTKNYKVSYSNDYALNISDIANTVYENLDGICDAYAMKATWNDPVLNANRSVYSQYGVAATAVRTLGGYSSFKDFNYETLPGYEQAWDLIDKMASGVKKAIEKACGKVEDLVDGVTIKDVTFEEPNKLGYTIDMTIELPTPYLAKGETGYIYIYDNVGNVIGAVPGTTKENDGHIIVLSFNSSQIDLYPYMAPVFAKIEEAYDDVNDTYGELRKLFDNVKGLLDDVKSYESKVDDVKTGLQNLLKALNDRVVDFINSANYRIQPKIIASSNLGANMLSGAKNYPSQIAATTDFILTNYTGEIIAPALKKHIACVNVFKGDASAQGGDADCKAKLQTINDNAEMNKVLEGSRVRINGISGFVKGYTYEIALSAVDYEGYQTTTKCYVTVK